MGAEHTEKPVYRGWFCTVMAENTEIAVQTAIWCHFKSIRLSRKAVGRLNIETIIVECLCGLLWPHVSPQGSCSDPRAWALQPDVLVWICFAIYQLCDLGPVPWTSCALVFSSVKWGQWCTVSDKRCRGKRMWSAQEVCTKPHTVVCIYPCLHVSKDLVPRTGS